MLMLRLPIAYAAMPQMLLCRVFDADAARLFSMLPLAAAYVLLPLLRLMLIRLRSHADIFIDAMLPCDAGHTLLSAAAMAAMPLLPAMLLMPGLLAARCCLLLAATLLAFSRC